MYQPTTIRHSLPDEIHPLLYKNCERVYIASQHLAAFLHLPPAMKMESVVILAILIGFTLASCRKKGEKTQYQIATEMLKDTTTVSFSETEYNFGTINEGDKAVHTFKIKNTGDKNLIIAQAYGSCGCTVPEYPKEPIAPGETGDITVTFNSAGKHGDQRKSITLMCNTERRSELLYMLGHVVPKDSITTK